MIVFHSVPAFAKKPGVFGYRHIQPAREFSRGLFAGDLWSVEVQVVNGFFQPETAGHVLQKEREVFLKNSAMAKQKERREKSNLECAVVLKKSPDKIGFIPRSAFKHPRLRVFERIKDIVNVNEHALRDQRKNFEDQVIHIASGFAYMRRIDKKNIAPLQFLEDGEIDILNVSSENTRLFAVGFRDRALQQLRIRVNKRHRDGA